MALPISVPYTFANATTTQNLSYLDANYNALANGLNGLANGTSQISISSISATGNANATTYLRGDGSWATVSGGGGSVTSINANSSIGFTFTGGPVTSSGTLTLSGPTPGTSGNVLTSNGTAWVSQASASGTVNSVNGFTGTVQSVVVQGTAVASTSGISITFTGIPSWAKRITVMFAGVSTNGTSNFLVQLVTGGGTISSGYNSGCNGGTAGVATATATNGFLATATISSASDLQGGVMTIFNVTSNIWCYSSVINTASSSGRFQSGGGNVNAGAAVTGVIVTTVSANTFATGNINIQYE